MVIGERVKLIVMLCKFAMKDRPQCEEYFPNKGKTMSTAHGKITCVKQEEIIPSELIQRQFVIETNRGEKMNLEHYQWLGWPDCGVPESKSYETLLMFVKMIVKHKKFNTKPIIIHCSAGIGRTGTLIAITNLAIIIKYVTDMAVNDPGILEKIQLSVFSIVRRMREQRSGMVQTYEQYELVNKFVDFVLQKDALKDM